MGDRLGEREPEPGAFLGTAALEPAEPTACFLAPFGRDAGPAVADLDPDHALARPHPDLDHTAGRSVANRVLHEIADRLGEQLPVAEQRYRPDRPVEVEARAAVVGE